MINLAIRSAVSCRFTISVIGIIGLTVCELFATEPSASSIASGNVASDNSGANSPFVLLPTKFLPNVVRLHQDVYSGGLPDGSDAFSELRSLGIQTIISVDGITPDVVLAESHQMRYIHLPHSYDSISESRVLEIAKAIRELPKPIYIHCHHGRHRSPAAASAACVAAGTIDTKDAVAVLELAGTGKNYIGLRATVASARFDPHRDWSLVKANFQPVSPVSTIIASMVAMDQTFHRIESFIRIVNAHSDVSVSPFSHDLLLLREAYVELHRDPMTIEDHAFATFLKDGIRSIEAMETLCLELQNEQTRSSSETSASLTVLTPGNSLNKSLRDSLSGSLTSMKDNCIACHQVYRDIPPPTCQLSSD